jgi:hypothetical protein
LKILQVPNSPLEDTGSQHQFGNSEDDFKKVYNSPEITLSERASQWDQRKSVEQASHITKPIFYGRESFPSEIITSEIPTKTENR